MFEREERKMKIEDIRNAINRDIPIEYSMHCQKRMLERNISRRDIYNCIHTGEIIEDYPVDENNTSDKSFPACLIMGMKCNENRMIHVVVGYNGKKVIIISACYPDSEYWENDYKTRRK